MVTLAQSRMISLSEKRIHSSDIPGTIRVIIYLCHYDTSSQPQYCLHSEALTQFGTEFKKSIQSCVKIGSLLIYLGSDNTFPHIVSVTANIMSCNFPAGITRRNIGLWLSNGLHDLFCHNHDSVI